MMIANKKAVTLVEVVIATVLLSVSLVVILQLVQSAYSYTRGLQDTIVVQQLAIEGADIVTQIRNTNLLKWSSQQGLCWLKVRPLEDEGEQGCENDPRMQKGIYTIKEYGSGGFYLERIQQDRPVELGNEKQFLLCRKNGLYTSCNEGDQNSGGTQFFRFVEIKELVDKSANGETIQCENGLLCVGKKIIEQYFCVSSWYVGNQRGQYEICSSLTNFSSIESE